MGSEYLLARGLGVPVADAFTNVVVFNRTVFPDGLVPST